jgi:hypothetical protein
MEERLGVLNEEIEMRGSRMGARRMGGAVY